jgi:hypothetical protein
LRIDKFKGIIQTCKKIPMILYYSKTNVFCLNTRTPDKKKQKVL